MERFVIDRQSPRLISVPLILSEFVGVLHKYDVTLICIKYVN